MENRKNKIDRRSGDDKRSDVVKIIEGERRSNSERRSKANPSKS